MSSPDHQNTHVQQLAHFAAGCRDEGVPDVVVRSVRQRVADVLGICVAARQLDTSQAAVAHVMDQGGRPQAHVVGEHELVPAAQAAFANGVLAHSLDYDDTHLPSVLHPSASVVPAALAVAEMVSASATAVAAAIASGLEICVRLGMAGYDHASRNSVFFQYGQHATSICGAIGSAAAAASILGLDEAGIAHSMAISVSFASGILEGNRTGGTVKRTHCGWAAHGGVTAAQLAARGFTGPPTVLEGKFGFFAAYIQGRFDPQALLGGLGAEWSVPGIFFKPYPANHFTHAGIDAAIAMRKAGLTAEDVDSAVLGTAAHTARTIGDPLAVKQRPETGYQAQFSGPYTVAAALIGGSGLGLGLADFDDALVREPRRRALMSRIDVVADPKCDEIFPYQFPATLRVRTRDGHELYEEVLTTRGGPERPLSDDEIRQKLVDNVDGVLSASAIDRLTRITEGENGLGGVRDLLAATIA